jgi:hypothetical protein
MKIKISDRFKEAVNPHLTRHWIDALLSLPDMEYIPELSEEYADLGIDTQNNVGKSVLLDLDDPQSKVNTFPVDELMYEEILKLLTVPSTKPSEIFKNNGDKGIEYIDSFDVYSPIIAISPAEKYIVPKLTHARFVPVYQSLPKHIFFNDLYKRDTDVFFAGAMWKEWYPLRNIFHNELSKSDLKYKFVNMNGDKAKTLIAENNSSIRNMQMAYDIQVMNYADNLRHSKIFIFCDSVFKYPLKKYMEGMACGSLILAPVPIDAERYGYVDGETMVKVDQDDFMEKIRFYLENESERKRITDNAYQLFKKRFTCEKSVERFMNEI